MDYWDNALDPNTVLYVLLRTAISTRLYEIVTFKRFFLKDLLAKKLVRCKRTKNIPHVIRLLTLTENFTGKKQRTFYLSQVNEHEYN